MLHNRLRPKDPFKYDQNENFKRSLKNAWCELRITHLSKAACGHEKLMSHILNQFRIAASLKINCSKSKAIFPVDFPKIEFIIYIPFSPSTTQIPYTCILVLQFWREELRIILITLCTKWTCLRYTEYWHAEHSCLLCIDDTPHTLRQFTHLSRNLSLVDRIRQTCFKKFQIILETG